jgi:hypothetical protein
MINRIKIVVDVLTEIISQWNIEIVDPGEGIPD